MRAERGPGGAVEGRAGPGGLAYTILYFQIRYYTRRERKEKGREGEREGGREGGREGEMERGREGVRAERGSRGGPMRAEVGPGAWLILYDTTLYYTIRCDAILLGGKGGREGQRERGTEGERHRGTNFP